MIALEWKRAKRRTSKLGFGIISWFELVCIGRRLMTTQLRICVLMISLVCKISTYRCNLNRRRVCSLGWVSENAVVFHESWFLFCSECKSSSVGEFDQWILMHILLCLYLVISILCFVYFTILLCFYNLVYFCLYLIFVFYFSALAAFNKKFITGATGIGSTRSNIRWKAERKRYNFHVEARSWFGL